VRYVEAGGARLSAIGLGTWQFGSREWAYGDTYADKVALEITARALDLGINLLDTAEIYAFGRSERILGAAIAGRREECFIATKILPVLPLSSVVQSRARKSLSRLGVRSVDLYQLHWPNPAVPLSKTMAGMACLKADGLVRHVGVSNYSLTRWCNAEAALGAPVLSNQVNFSMVHREPEKDLVPWAAAHDHIVIAYSPVAQGLLSGRYDSSHRPTGMRATGTLFLPENLERASGLLSVLREVADAHDAAPAQIALAWVIRRPNVVAIPGASSVAQVEANAAATDIELTDDEEAALTSAAEAFHPVSGPATVPTKLKIRFGGS
jgi:aryl-alcohol dehydrogenase-like predicted oxidoreductase